MESILFNKAQINIKPYKYYKCKLIIEIVNTYVYKSKLINVCFR